MPVNSYNSNINWLAQGPNDGIAARIRKMLGNSPYGMTPGINPNAPPGPIGGAAVDPSMVGPMATLTPQDYAAILRAQSGQAANEIEAARSLQQQASDTSPLAVGDPGFGAVARVLAGVRGRRDMKRARTGFEEDLSNAATAQSQMDKAKAEHDAAVLNWKNMQEETRLREQIRSREGIAALNRDAAGERTRAQIASTEEIAARKIDADHQKPGRTEQDFRFADNMARQKYGVSYFELDEARREEINAVIKQFRPNYGTTISFGSPRGLPEE